MTPHYEIEQGTYEWHESRYGKIGGTLASSILVKSDTLLNDLVSARLEPFTHDDDEYKSADMERGSFYEGEAVHKLGEKYNVNFKPVGWVQSDEFPYVGISPDGISECETVQAEVKCPNRKNHTKYLREQILPLAYVDQVTHAFLVNDKLEKLLFASYRPESIVPMFDIEITRESVLNYGTEKTPQLISVSNRIETLRTALTSLFERVDSEVYRLTF